MEVTLFSSPVLMSASQEYWRTRAHVDPKWLFHKSQCPAPYARSRRVLPFFWLGVLSSIAVLLAVMATLQFRSSTEIKDAEQAQVGTDLESVMIKWHLDFYGEFSNVCVALQIGPIPANGTAGRTIYIATPTGAMQRPGQIP